MEEGEGQVVAGAWWSSAEAQWKPVCPLIIREPLLQIFTGSSCCSFGLDHGSQCLNEEG